MNNTSSDIELTILMPCLNEEETIAICIIKAKQYIEQNNINGEILIADNGSTDSSQQIALNAGARLIHVPQKGYGAALRKGIEAARGKFIIMGDADDSYDFRTLTSFLAQLRAGYALVVGNRFLGGIEEGAMPFLHRYIGNPVLSFLGRLFFKIPVRDFHCGLRGFNKEAIQDLHCHTAGMEFASEMIVKAALANLTIAEVPTTLAKDGRKRAPHLRTWRDGWRHLCFLLMYAPRWLFVYPGLTMLLIGIVSSLILLQDNISIGNIYLGTKTFIVSSLAILIGFQYITFGIIVRQYTIKAKILPQSRQYSKFLLSISHNTIIITSLLLFIIGSILALWCFSKWSAADFGALGVMFIDKEMILSITMISCAVQTFLAGFICAIIRTEQQ